MKKNLVIALTAIVAFSPAAQAAILSYQAVLSGPAESPPNASPGTGFATVDYDNILHTLAVHVDFSGLVSPVSISHIHSATTVPGTGTAIVATPSPTFPGFPAGVTAGTYTNTLDLTLLASYNGAFVTANGGTAASAEAALALGLADGKAYWNIHTQASPSGEIRGFLLPVPEPSSLALLALGALALRRRRA